MKLTKVEINFPLSVDVPDDWQQRLCELVGEVCKKYEAAHPGRVMWVFGVGSKITYMPMTQEEERERGLEFDNDTLELQVSERERYHRWFTPKFIGYECCRDCGIVRRTDDKNGPCKGRVGVGPRAEPLSPEQPDKERQDV